MWEAWVTLGFFPLLLVVAWVVDTEPWKKENIVSVLWSHHVLSRLCSDSAQQTEMTASSTGHEPRFQHDTPSAYALLMNRIAIIALSCRH